MNDLEARYQELVALDKERTQGDWVAGHHVVNDQNGMPICGVACTRGKYEPEKANRTFIAAAPAMMALLRDYREALAKFQWHQIESAPKDGSHFIAWDNKFKCPLFTMHWEDGEFLTNGEIWSGEFTLWMPLPPAPKPEDSV